MRISCRRLHDTSHATSSPSILCKLVTIKVCHKILCDKIKTFGIDGCYMRWIINFLSGRLQYVEYDSIKSTTTAVPLGTIQGSAIGGTLFCMFVNDLCDMIRYCNKWLSADDVKMVHMCS